jgi:hypothetical protein
MAKEVAKTSKQVVETYDIANANETLYLAQDLAKFISENNLAMPIQGKDYVNVEGWQYAGSRLGIVPIIETLERQAAAASDEIKYQAHVKLLDLKSGNQVGSGFAICSNKEGGKRYYQEFAIASMAQTRAIGKAYRNILAWIIRAAGYEPTPAEEMDFLMPSNQAPQKISYSKGNTDRPAKSNRSSDSEPAKEAKPQAEATKPVEAPEVEKPAPRMATVKQKTELLLLLNNAKITSSEKNKMIENINTLDNDRIVKAIDKIKQVIEEREGEAAQAA